MRAQKAIAIAAALVLLLAGGAYAVFPTPYDPHAGLEDYIQGVPSQAEKAAEGEAVFFSGLVEGFNDENRELMVRITVPGILGETETTLPYRIGDDTTVTVCLASTNQCESSASGDEGWGLIKRMESSGLSDVLKRVIIVGEHDSDRIVHVHVDYNDV